MSKPAAKRCPKWADGQHLYERRLRGSCFGGSVSILPAYGPKVCICGHGVPTVAVRLDLDRPRRMERAK